MSKRNIALLAALAATTIYGLNHTIAKGAMPHYVGPYGFIMLRLGGASILFWIVSFLGPKEKIARKDWGRILACSLLGMAINMLAFFKGLQLSTPINSAVLVTITPIIVVVLSALFIKEKVTLNKGLGIFLGFIGALGLILFGAEIRQDAPNIPLGNILFVLNATVYGSYLILVKKLTEKYHPLTLMKWLFSIGFVLAFPVTYPEFTQIEWTTLPNWVYGVIAFVVIGTTFMTYLFNVFALTQLRASTVGAFVYVQPLIGIIFAMFSGKDHLTFIKIAATVFVLLGVYLASRKPKATP
ncbi:DMT family transporter [Muricauda sp. 2012CJ35-5]|uniref:DMT family transporter n=1 Tax=Flagellimonas spongiicola TaxID=2942208 RepID=A0ABT0PRS4_9FLAO|nr:DMT family transporter [Allomuricauda spongiicola]MCL6274073.1 DMT family transporter [Allomuricauda spongiicola]